MREFADTGGGAVKKCEILANILNGSPLGEQGGLKEQCLGIQVFSFTSLEEDSERQSKGEAEGARGKQPATLTTEEREEKAESVQN